MSDDQSSRRSSGDNRRGDSPANYEEESASVSAAKNPSRLAKEQFRYDFPATVETGEKPRPTPDDEQEVTDRAAVIGQDGRWVAGWALRIIVLAGAGYLLFKGLGLIWVGLLPVVLALLICTVLWPPVRVLREKAHFPAALAVLVTILGAFALFAAVIAAIAPSVVNQVPTLVRRAEEGIQSIIDWMQGPPLNLELEQLQNAVNEIGTVLQESSGQIFSGVVTGLSTATSFLVTVFVTLVLTFFFLKDGPRFLPWLRKYLGGNVGWHLTEVFSRTWNTLAGFIRTQAIVSFVDAFFIGLGLVIMQVPLAFALAVITFIAGFIPIVGAITAGALAVVVALVTNGFWPAVIVLVIIIAVQQLESNILQPVLQSKAMNLHAAIVLLAVTVGSTLFGIIGAFLAVPVAATLAVWLRYHSEMVALRAGEITIDDIKIDTDNSKTKSTLESFSSVRDRLKRIATRRDEDEGAAVPVGRPSD